MCSPYAGSANNRSTSASYASGRLSATNARTASRVGGSPVRSNVTRRINVRLSAAFAGCKPAASTRASTNRSIGSWPHFVSLTFGNTGFLGGTNAQNTSYFAPARIHFLMISCSRFVSGFLCEPSGGIRSSVSVEVTRAHSSLSSRDPGFIAATPLRTRYAPSTPSILSSRSFALRSSPSGP